MNEYVLEILTRERLAEMRAQGERCARLWGAGPASPSLCEALVRLGHRVRAALAHSWARGDHDVIETERTPVGGALRE